MKIKGFINFVTLIHDRLKSLPCDARVVTRREKKIYRLATQKTKILPLIMYVAGWLAKNLSPNKYEVLFFLPGLPLYATRSVMTDLEYEVTVMNYLLDPPYPWGTWKISEQKYWEQRTITGGAGGVVIAISVPMGERSFDFRKWQLPSNCWSRA